MDKGRGLMEKRVRNMMVLVLAVLVTTAALVGWKEAFPEPGERLFPFVAVGVSVLFGIFIGWRQWRYKRRVPEWQKRLDREAFLRWQEGDSCLAWFYRILLWVFLIGTVGHVLFTLYEMRERSVARANERPARAVVEHGESQ